MRTLAASLGLSNIAALPAQPCLASRIQTGIPIRAEDLTFAHWVETEARRVAPHLDYIRCRVTPDGVALELGSPDAEAEERVAELCRSSGRRFLGARPYQRGSAFRGAS